MEGSVKFIFWAVVVVAGFFMLRACVDSASALNVCNRSIEMYEKTMTHDAAVEAAFTDEPACYKAYPNG